MKKLSIRVAILAVCLLGHSTRAAHADSPTVAQSRADAMQSTRRMTWRPVSAKHSESPVEPASYEEPVSAVFGEPVTFDGSCDCSACDAYPPQSCCPSGRTNPFWIRAEYLLWSLDGISLPALVTTSPTGTLPENTGVIGQLGTTVLFGDSSYVDSFRSGGRVTVGLLDDACGNGFEVSVLGIFKSDDTFRDSRGLLARPVFDTTTSSEASMLIAHPDFLAGEVSARVSNDLAMLDIYRRQRISSSRCQSLDVLVGYRHGRLNEMLRLDQSSVYTAAQGQIISGTTVSLFDEFTAENRFHGAQLGLQYEQRSATTTLSMFAKLGFGVNQAKATIDGSTVSTVPGGGSATFAGGLLAQTTNIGTYDESEFAVLPEIGLNLRMRVDDRLEFLVGYSVLYWSDAVRVADQVNRSVSQFPPEPATGTGDPAYEFQTDDFLAHGLNVGAVFTF